MSRSKISKPRDSAIDPRPIDDLRATVDVALRSCASLDALDRLLGDTIESMNIVIPFDLAAIFEVDGDELRVRVARGPLASGAVRQHRIRLADFPSLANALREKRALAFLEHDHRDGDGDPFDGVLDLPHGHHCMVIPLATDTATLGILTFDRAECGSYSRDVLRLAAEVGRLLAIAIEFGRQCVQLVHFRDQLAEQNRLLRLEASAGEDPCRLLESTASPAMSRVVALARSVAGEEVPVLITGETGTGKEVVAQSIHAWSRRAPMPMVSINCAALPPGLVESELFGHVKGAFSGAEASRVGRFVAANGSTLFFDEIGELPIAMQAKLLRVLEEGCFEPVGSDRTVRVDVRIIAATNVDLAQAVEDGRFRRDLYYRLAVFPIEVPPLRERVADIEPIARHWLASRARRFGSAALRLSDAPLRALERRTWPGNVRELLNVLERAAILSRDGELRFDAGGDAVTAVASAAARSLRSESGATLEDVERRHIVDVLAKTGGRIYGKAGAAEALGMNPSTLRSRMEKLGIPGARVLRAERNSAKP